MTSSQPVTFVLDEGSMPKVLAMNVSKFLPASTYWNQLITFVSKGINQKYPHETNLVTSGFIMKILKAILGAFQEDFGPQKTHKERK